MNTDVEKKIDDRVDKVAVAKAAAELLTEFLKADPNGCTDLLERRVNTTKAVADHPTIQVAGTEANPKVGMLGVLNGILERACGHRVVVHVDGDTVVGFSSIEAAEYDRRNP